ncbi:fasciclin domain-containing protein [Blastomonas sp.]|uniref:fasciclin domain-containing protein n=1 Tax=Blastomonas sp. TaxID=1909299 RepID=UPI00262C3113|nr:fasciclin domain-containing protein [Blastomonas sp.]MDM7958009.1 fasciclin domain-containing protein [Blastomonas sp.]
MPADGTAVADGMDPSGNVMVGGAQMLPTRNIVENASESPLHTTLVSAVTAAGLVDTLSGTGPFTVFAPVNAAFEKLPAGAVDSLMKPESKARLGAVLTYHVVSGRMTASDIAQAITDGNGTATLTTVQGENLTAKMDGSNVVLTGEGGSTAIVTQADVPQSNGVIHVIDGVLMPKA